MNRRRPLLRGADFGWKHGMTGGDELERRKRGGRARAAVTRDAQHRGMLSPAVPPHPLMTQAQTPPPQQKQQEQVVVVEKQDKMVVVVEKHD